MRAFRNCAATAEVPGDGITSMLVEVCLHGSLIIDGVKGEVLYAVNASAF